MSLLLVALTTSLIATWSLDPCFATAEGFKPSPQDVPSTARKITSYTNISRPVIGYRSDGAPVMTCMPTPASEIELNFLHAAILVDQGASAYEVVFLHQFLRDRGAKVTIYSPLTAPALLFLDEYLPQLTTKDFFHVNALRADVTINLMIVPSGYNHVEELRTHSSAASAIFDHLTTGSGAGKSALFIGGGSEMLISSDILSKLDRGTQLPDTGSPSILSAMEALPKNAIEKSPIVGAARTHDLSVNDSLRVVNAAINGTQARVIVSQNSSFITDALLSVAELYQAPPPNNTCGTAISVDERVFDKVTDTNFLGLNAEANKGLRMSVLDPVEAVERCKNNDRINFCSGWQFAVIVSHGSHDVEVFSAMKSLKSAGATVNVYCPDYVVTERRTVYLSPRPPYAPSYELHCDGLLSDWAFLSKGLSGTSIIPGGFIATHGVLRQDIDVNNVLRHTGTFSLSGSALILLSRHDVREDNVPVVPQSSSGTDLDLRIKGLTVSTNSSSTVSYRSLTLQRTKVLTGYGGETGGDATAPMEFDRLLNYTISAIVWQSALNHRHDAFVGIIFLLIAGGLLVAVIAVTCYRTKVLARRHNHERLPKDEEEADPTVRVEAEL